VLRERAQLALEAARWIGENDDRQALLELLADGDGLLWALDLPSGLSEAGLHEQALELCEALEFVRGEQETRSERPFLLARAGRTDEARAQAERWLAESPEDAWAWLLTGDLFALLGDGARARAGVERAEALGADDLDLRAAALERRLALAHEGGRASEAERLERELEELQVALAEDAEGASELDEAFATGRLDSSASTGRNEPCPCGSGMKYKRCCGSAAVGTQSDATRVVEFLEELVREADTPKLTRALQEALPRFAGEALAGLGVGAALPLLPRDDLPEALVHWAVLDCDLGDGTRVIERVLKRRRSGARESELFGRLADSAPSAWRVESCTGGRDARLIDQLEAAAEPVLLRGVSDLPQGAILCARVLELDGEPVLGPGTILLEGEAGERWLAGVRARLNELRAAEPDLEWRAFLRRHAHELYRPLADTP
jgi:tetratricopeptide (TPR) repeat protein